MSDIADDAEKQAEDFLAHSLKARRPGGPVYTGFCLNCDDDLDPPNRWCGSECRDEWQRRQTRESHGNS